MFSRKHGQAVPTVQGQDIAEAASARDRHPNPRGVLSPEDLLDPRAWSVLCRQEQWPVLRLNTALLSGGSSLWLSRAQTSLALRLM